MSLKLTILSPERKLAENLSVEEVTLTGTEGQIQILPGHSNMVGKLETGVFGYKNSGGTMANGFISTGFFEVKEDAVVVAAEVMELQGEIDVERAKRAQALAEKALHEANIDEARFRKYSLKLQRALIRQQLGGRQ